MKRFLNFLIISLVIVIGSFSIFKFSSKYGINTLKNNISWSIAAKNYKNSIGFDKDENGNTYIAYSDYIKKLGEDGREDVILNDKSLNIETMIYYENSIFFISKDKLYRYNMENNKLDEVLKEIPYEGNYLNRNLIIKDKKILLSIGTATNSGVAYDSGDYNINKIPYDKSPINITLNGFNYGEKKTGAFMPYGNSSAEGQKIKAEDIGNGSIIEINIDKRNFILYACGIRNIKGWDLDSDENLIAIVGGMENLGNRPINRDFDYLYKIDKGKWYGWPDFSGGDPISSPRFKGENVVSRLIANPPNKTVPAPLYQYDKLGAIKYLAIDKDGKVIGKDSKIFYDSKDNMISALNSDGTINQLLKLKNESRITGIKYYKDSFYILDSGIGCIYKLHSNDYNLTFNLPKSIIIFICFLMFSILCIIIVKFNKKKNR